MRPTPRRRAGARRDAPATPGAREIRWIAARHSSTSPTHSNGLSPPVAVSSAKPSYCARSSSRSLPKISVSCRGRHERREDQEHEATFVAVTAPRAEPLVGIELEDAIAARERRSDIARAWRKPRRCGSSEAGAQDREDRRARHGSRRRRRPAARSARRLFENWWLTSIPFQGEVAGRGASARSRAQPRRSPASPPSAGRRS